MTTPKALLTNAGLDNTSQGVVIIRAVERGGFTQEEKDTTAVIWPFDSDYTKAVQADNFLRAATRIIELELSLKREFEITQARWHREDEMRKR